MKAGRSKNTYMAVKVRELKDSGMSNRDIAATLEMKLPMVQYYLRQRVKDEDIKEANRQGLATCFWKADEETRIKVAELIHYNYTPAVKDSRWEMSVAEAYAKLAEKQGNNIDIVEIAKKPVENTSSLLARAIKFLNGEIAPTNIDENFSQDEIDKLNKSPRFIARNYQISWGIKTSVTNEQAIDELKNMGVD